MKPILIHCHIYYTSLWPELKQCIQNVAPYPFDLFVTMVEKHPDIEADVRQTFPKAHIEVVANQGYDIGPFAEIIRRSDLNQYAYVIKLHTKRDMPTGALLGCMNVSGKRWREYALSFLKTPKTFAKVMQAFEQNKKLGMHGNYHLIMDTETQDPKSAAKDRELLIKTGLKNSVESFVAGTIFMGRAALFKPFKKLSLKLSNFETPDRRHENATLAHVAERFLGYMIGGQGYQIKDVASACLLAGPFWNGLRRLGLFLYRYKVDGKKHLTIRICRIPICILQGNKRLWVSDKKANGRVHIYFLGVKVFSFKKRNKLVPINKKYVRPVIIVNKTAEKKGVIYTCITGGYDNLIQHNCINRNFDYVCFTDNPELLKQKQVGIWQIRPLMFDQLDCTKNARWHKMHPHILFPEYHLSIWVDSNTDILSPKLFRILAAHKNKKLLVPIHFSRDCIYDECHAVIQNKKETVENVSKMRSFLNEARMPKHYGLNETNILIRQHHDIQVQKLMEQWWSFIKKYTKRDQLSFSYVLWKNGIQVDEISFENARFDGKNYYFEDHIGHAFLVPKESQ